MTSTIKQIIAHLHADGTIGNETRRAWIAELERHEAVHQYDREQAVNEWKERAEKAEAAVQEWLDSTTATMDEKCGKDEKHCTCVPLLRHEARQLRAEASTYAKAVHRLQKAFDDQCNASRQDAQEIERLKASLGKAEAAGAEKDAVLRSW